MMIKILADMHKHLNFLGGIMIITATVIGAGMLAIPIAGAGVWFFVATLVLLFSAIIMLCSGLFILETNLHFPQGASLNTIVKNILGPKWNLATGLCLVFMFYVLLYAYISTGSSFLIDFISQSNVTTEVLTRIAVTVLFTFFIAILVGISSQVVGFFSIILMMVLVCSFFLSITESIPNISAVTLFRNQPSNLLSFGYWQYLAIIFPVCLASFGFHGNVASLIKHFNGNLFKIKYSIFIGIFIALIIYFIWLLVVHGNIDRSFFQGIQLTKQNEVVATINKLGSLQNQSMHYITLVMQIFSFTAVVSSFLGVALGVLDYFLDLFDLRENWQGRSMACIITFIPPMIASIIFPYGFTIAIGYVGFAAAFWAVIVPALLVRKSRKIYPKAEYQVRGGNVAIMIVIAFGVLNIVAMILMQLKYIHPF